MKKNFECLCMIINKDTKGYYFVTDYHFGGDYFTNVKKRMTKQEYENTKNLLGKHPFKRIAETRNLAQIFYLARKPLYGYFPSSQVLSLELEKYVVKSNHPGTSRWILRNEEESTSHKRF